MSTRATEAEAVPVVVADDSTQPYSLGDDDEARCLYLVEYGTQGDAAVATALASALAHFTEPARREGARRFLRAEARRRRRRLDTAPEDLDALLATRIKPCE